MDHQPNHPIPAHLAELVEACISNARHELTRVGHLHPVAFIGGSGFRKSFIYPLEEANSKEEAIEFIRLFATLTLSDFVFTIMEAWMLEPNHTQEYEEIIELYGSLENSPDSIECVVFTLETHAGTWCGVAEQKPLNDSQAKTFGEVEMRMQEKPEGRMFGLLPPRNSGHEVH